MSNLPSATKWEENMLTRKNTYDEVYNSFRWSVPEYYNIGVDVCDKWAEERLPSRPDL